MAVVLASPDKFRGTLSAAEAAAAVAAGAAAAGWEAVVQPVSDGGEGFATCFRGTTRTARVTDPLGRPVEASFTMLGRGRTAAVEMATAAGLALVGGPEGNDPLQASTAGAGRLVAAAVGAGARRVLVGCGGSATTDGGWGAVEALGFGSKLAGVEVVVGCDVELCFLEAARVFGPQKGATPRQVELLTRRLERLAGEYERRFGVDVRTLAGSGAAGGFAGGLAALGGELVPGFELVAEAVDLHDKVAGADLVVTGEGLLDEQSFQGKAVGGVCALAAELGTPVLVVCGDRAEGVEPPPGVMHTSLVEAFGRERAEGDTAAAIRDVVGRALG